MIPELEELMADAERGRPFPGANEWYLLDIEHGPIARRAVSILEYVTSFVSDFQKNYMDGLSTGAILSNLDTLHRYSNNYIILSPVRSLDVPGPLLTPDSLYEKLIEKL